jgi:hypothetical protein
MMAKKRQRNNRRIPALLPDQLTGALLRLESLKIDNAAKQKLRDMLEAAANPDSQRIEVVVSGLPLQHRRQVKATATKVASRTRGVLTRAERELMEMSEAEWQRLVREANGGT